MAAGAALWLFALPAQAGLAMQFKDISTGDGFRVTENSSGMFTLQVLGNSSHVMVHNLSGNAAANTVSASVTVDGYTFNVTEQSNRLNTSSPLSSVSLNTTVTASPGAKATKFSFFGSDTPFTSPGTSSSTAYLQSSLFTESNYTSGNKVADRGKAITSGANKTFLTGQAGPLSGPNQSANSNAAKMSHRGSSYTLETLGGISLNGKGTTHFFAQAGVALPEPAGILIGLLGVPCMGLVVLFARRRGARASAQA
jgi:hypothetical protein